ncbi:MAG TPA: hypothetical protein VER55_03705 [Ardenticatenaceae bacterium]|nr:hypothetical protein [Ardenticatenaceae bacterium]
MELFFELTTWLHIGAGVTALLVAPVATITQKGGRSHRRWGKVYFWAMATIFGTALTMLVRRPSIFLLAVSVFSFYNALAGYRVLRRKRAETEASQLLDRAASAITLGAGIILMGWGGTLLLSANGSTPFAGLGVVFGVLISQLGLEDLRALRPPSEDRNAWWYTHMARMLSSYIGVTTAFLVQTAAPRLVATGMPVGWVWIVWVAPAMMGVPAANIWINAYKKRFAARRGPTVALAAEV